MKQAEYEEEVVVLMKKKKRRKLKEYDPAPTMVHTLAATTASPTGKTTFHSQTR